MTNTATLTCWCGQPASHVSEPTDASPATLLCDEHTAARAHVGVWGVTENHPRARRLIVEALEARASVDYAEEL